MRGSSHILWMRSEGNKCIANLKEKPIKEFMKKLNIQEPIIYKYNSDYTILTIHTKHPGAWIGLYGRDNLLLEKILEDNFGHKVKVNYKQIDGDFIVNSEE